MIGIKAYLFRIYAARYFWLHLVKSDLVFKYRRSFFGILWTLLQPLCMTILLGLVFGTIFHSPFLEFAPFVYSGLIAWDFVCSSFITGANCMINAEAYIKQVHHPLGIYSLKQALVCTANFGIASIGLLLWCFVMYPGHIVITLLCLPMILFLYVSLAWGITTVSSFINIKYRDFQQMMGLILQAVWFVSPVYFEPKVFIAAGMPGLVEYNPVTHLLNILRKPLLEGAFPTCDDVLLTAGLIAFFGIWAVLKIRKEERDMIFYL